MTLMPSFNLFSTLSLQDGYVPSAALTLLIARTTASVEKAGKKLSDFPSPATFEVRPFFMNTRFNLTPTLTLTLDHYLETLGGPI